MILNIAVEPFFTSFISDWREVRHQWIEENSARGVTKRSRGVQNTRNDQMAIKRSDLSQGKARDPRDAELSDDTPLYWVPYVHFGV